MTSTSVDVLSVVDTVTVRLTKLHQWVPCNLLMPGAYSRKKSKPAKPDVMSFFVATCKHPARMLSTDRSMPAARTVVMWLALSSAKR